MSRLENFTMYAEDRQAASALVSMKVEGNAGPEIDRKVRVDLVNLRTIHMEYDPCRRKGRLPAYFARVFGLQVAPIVMLRDPNRNEIEVAVEKRNGKVYFTEGWPFLKKYYGIGACAWVTFIYANRHLFLLEVRNLHGREVVYPQSNPPQRWLLQGYLACAYKSSFVPYGAAALGLRHVPLCNVLIKPTTGLPIMLMGSICVKSTTICFAVQLRARKISDQHVRCYGASQAICWCGC